VPLPPDGTTLRRAVAAHLPEYMIPSTFVRLDTLPLTPSGKIDRAALPERLVDSEPPPEPADPSDPSDPSDATGVPRSPVEDLLCELFAEILERGPVGPHDSFFELGGNSLLAIRLASRVHAVLGVKAPLHTLLQAPTVAQLYATLMGTQHGASALEPVLALRASGSRPPLFCVHPSSGLAWSYAGLLRFVPRHHPVYGLQADGLEPGATRSSSMDALVDTYVARIRALRPHGPYLLLGWSLGGRIAHQLAARLAAQGEAVPLLVVLDARPAGRNAAAPHTAYDLLRTAFDGSPAFGTDIGTTLPEPERIRQILGGTGTALGSLSSRAIGAILDTTAHHFQLGRAAGSLASFDGDMLLITGTPQPGAADLAVDWKPYVTGHIDTHHVAVEHLRMMSPGALRELGPLLSRRLRRLP
jgi:thioesterase domain-containing protein